MAIHLKRIYDEPAAEDGTRILVDRLWPRGVSKVEAHVDLWFKDIAPSNDLRKWFNHDPVKWKEFQEKYHEELAQNTTAVKALREHLHGNVTLLYAAKDTEHNNAVALKAFLEL
jgi:uncharacterized protein YeaO (DUF488 family)